MKTLFKNILAVLFLLNLNAIKGQSSFVSDEDSPFIFNHTTNKIFTVPTAETQRNFDFGIRFGSYFDGISSKNVHAEANVGILNFLEFEFITISPLKYSLQKSEFSNNAGLKIQLFAERKYTPSFSIGVIKNLGNIYSEFDESAILTNDDNVISPRQLGFDLNYWSAYLVLTKRLSPYVKLHLGLRNYFVKISNQRFSDENSTKTLDNQGSNLISPFIGLEARINSRVIFQMEALKYPLMNLSDLTNDIQLASIIAGSAGLRYLLLKWLTFDAGLYFQSNYKSIYNSELRVGLGGVWSL